jgi:hypothetical protein
MTAAIIPLAKPESDDAIDKLLEQRAGVLAEIQRLGTIDRPIQEAESAVAAIDRAIATLDEGERSRTEEWAASGVGDPPSPRNAERAGLVQRRLELQSDVEGAKNRAAAVGPRRMALNGELRRIDHQLFAEKLRSALEEARRLDAHAHELALQMRAPIGRVAALKIALIGHASGDKAAERLVGEAIDALSRFKMPELGGDPAKLGGFVDEWQEMLR